MPDLSSPTTIEFQLPRNGNSSALVFQLIYLPRPRLRTINIRIPAGHRGLVNMNIQAPGHGMLAPEPIGSNIRFIRGDNEEKDFNPNILLEGAPMRYQLELRGYNTDTTFDHTFIITLFTSVR